MSTGQPYDCGGLVPAGRWVHVDYSTQDMTARMIERDVEHAEYLYNLRCVANTFSTLFATPFAKYRAEDKNRSQFQKDLADIARRYGFDSATGEFKQERLSR